jgi:dephospho-CoA kinase
MRAVTRLGLTGGIGSGKSTVAQMLADLGAAVVDADAISRQTTAPGGAAIEPIRQAFGPDFITVAGALDRERMRSLAFSDPDVRRRLEQIIHPLVGQETRRQAQMAMEAGHRCIVFDIPLLVESAHWRRMLDQVLVLDCSPETQISRVMQRSGLSRPEVEKILASQAGRSARLHAADVVICNDGASLPELGDLVRQLAQRFGL